jgi:hypothetical protein
VLGQQAKQSGPRRSVAHTLIRKGRRQTRGDSAPVNRLGHIRDEKCVNKTRAYAGISLGCRRCNRARHRVYSAGKLDENAIAGGLNDAAFVLRYDRRPARSRRADRGLVERDRGEHAAGRGLRLPASDRPWESNEMKALARLVGSVPGHDQPGMSC